MTDDSEWTPELRAAWRGDMARIKAETLAAAAALIRAATEVRLTILPLAHNGEVVVRHINEEWAKAVEGLGNG